MTNERTDQLTPTSHEHRVPLEAVVIEVIAGPDAGASLELEAGTALVGTDGSNRLRLSDSAVSSTHAAFEVVRGAVLVRDLGSKNGTRYLGAKIQEARLPLGASVTLGRSTLRLRPRTARPAVTGPSELHGLLGTSPAMRALFADLERVAGADHAVLVQGETGAGKERVARALHAGSKRAAQPFVVFDASATNPQLLESALFGHVKGAFSGAVSSNAGAVASAKGGTLYLDGIDELPLEVQPKLLRLIGEREIQPVGSTEREKVDVRVIASSSANLEAAVARGALRQDLYFRVAVVTLVVPPLRERPEDIPLLARALAREVTGLDVELAPETLAHLQCQTWPGNVRELRNAVERALTLGDPAQKDGASGTPPTFAALTNAFERDYLTALLKRHQGNVAAAVRESKIARSQFYRLLERHSLSVDEMRPGTK